MTVSIIVAMAENRAIGKDNALPWHLSADLKFFKSVTMGKPMIMGRKTFESIGRPLPGRRTIVVTHNPSWSADGVETAGSLPEALEMASGAPEIMVVGGAQIYEQALPLADKLVITEVALTVDGDAFFPAIDETNWKEVSRESHAREGDQPAYAWVIYGRA